MFNTSVTTISKWKNREEFEDKSSCPHEIVFALNELEQALSITIRKTTWLPLDEVWELLLNVKTPMQAIEKWIDMKPEICKQKPVEFKNIILVLKNSNEPPGFHKQPCKT